MGVPADDGRMSVAKKKAAHLPVTVETFLYPGPWHTRQFERHNEPSVFNGIVSVRKYRVTFEAIDEPDDVILARIHELWERCDNMHSVRPLIDAAEELGAELDWERKGIKA